MNLSLAGFTDVWTASYLLMLARLIGVVFTTPLLSSNSVPSTAKMGLSAAVAFALLPATPPAGAQTAGWWLMAVLMREFIVGAAMGFSVALTFGALQWAAELIDFQIGFGFASMFDPMSQSRSALVGRATGIVAMWLFLIMDGHHLMLRAVAASFRVLPVGTAQFSPALAPLISQSWGQAVVFAMRLALPMIIALLLIDLASGVISRVLPQMNVFIVGMPVKIAVGFVLLGLILPIFVLVMDNLLSALTRDFSTMLTLMRR